LIYIDNHCKFTVVHHAERILKIGEHLAKSRKTVSLIMAHVRFTMTVSKHVCVSCIFYFSRQHDVFWRDTAER